MEINKFKLTKEDFIFLQGYLLSWGFVKITRRDFAKVFRRLDLQMPRRRTDRETGFMYTNNGYTVIVWTSYIEDEEKWRDTGTDYAWVLIKEGDFVKYFAKPLIRMKSMILKLLRYAWVSKWRVDNRHLCPKCDAYMDIGKRHDRRGYYHICKNTDKHEDGLPFTYGWDHNLPPLAQEFVNIRREYTRQYKERNKRLGLTPKPIATIRKRAIVNKPENLV